MEKILLLCLAFACSTKQGDVLRKTVIKPALNAVTKVASTVYAPLLLTTVVAAFVVNKITEKNMGKRMFHFPHHDNSDVPHLNHRKAVV